MLEINGHKYSKEPFNGHKFRAKFEFEIKGETDKTSIDIFTTNPDKEIVYETVKSRVNEKVTHVEMSYWTTKEKDEKQSKMLEAIILNWNEPTETNTSTNTVEEAAEKANPIIKRSSPFGNKYDWTPHRERKQFINGANWQKEQDEAKYKALKESHQITLQKVSEVMEQCDGHGVLNQEWLRGFCQSIINNAEKTLTND